MSLAIVFMHDMLVFKSLFVNWKYRTTQLPHLPVFVVTIILTACFVPMQAQSSADQNTPTQSNQQSNILAQPQLQDNQQSIPRLRPTPADIQSPVHDLKQSPAAIPIPNSKQASANIILQLPTGNSKQDSADISQPLQLDSQQTSLVEIKPLAAPQIPIPPQVVLPDLVQPVITKEPLAWRAKALAMSVEYPFNEKNGAIWVLPLPYDKARALLKSAIKQASLELIAEYPDAGQYLICVPNNGSTDKPVGDQSAVGARFIKPAISNHLHPSAILVSQPAGESKTLFKLRIYSGSNIESNNKIYTLPLVMKQLFENRGLWQ